MQRRCIIFKRIRSQVSSLFVTELFSLYLENIIRTCNRRSKKNSFLRNFCNN
ncbi:unnamed protein product [Tenebrio molitor]|nr:unnamed protein product [Tenebrio molitor]